MTRAKPNPIANIRARLIVLPALFCFVCDSLMGGVSMRVRLLALAVVVAACGGGEPTKPSTNTTVDVYTNQSTFSSNFVTINVGDTVRWHFSVASDGFGHNVLFNPRPPGTPADIDEKKSGTDFRVFSTPGMYHYVCTLHGSMTGDVVVQ